jgi:sterol desaturase/sphingolipid hydroxylase (fatty acid hydroxylase superfamily)
LVPATLVGCVGLAWALVAAGWPAFAMFAGAPAAIVCFVAERVQPHAPLWRESRGDVLTDVLHTVVSQGGGAFVAGFAVQGLADLVSPPRWDLPIAVQVGIALCVAELGQYAWHRACHASPRLWRLHATHHSALRLRWLTSSRFHPIEVFAIYLASYGPLVVLGLSPDVLAFVSTIAVVIAIFQHANVDLRLGPLNWIVSGPELHRWHHTGERTTQDTNFGGTLIVWDVVFGTRFAPRAAPDPRDVGFRGAHDFPRDYVGQIGSPFR